VKEKLRRDRDYKPIQEIVAEINQILRGWANYFHVGNSSRAFDTARFHVERKVRRFAVKKLKRKGFGWSRWSRDVVYRKWGLYDDYRIRYYRAPKARSAERNHYPDGMTPSR
jgi:RNA-directed DNA polymerase